MGHHRFIAGPREGLRHRSGFVRAIVLVIVAACLSTAPRSVSADANETPVGSANASAQASITAGGDHTCALLSGVLTCWGLNGHGQLGNGTTTNLSEPTHVTGLTSGVTAIAAGGNHTCAVHSGAAKCWGSGDWGKLGDGGSGRKTTPTQASGLTSGVSAITAGANHTCALVDNGTTSTVWCWGYAASGALGIGEVVGQVDNRFVSTPRSLSLTDVTAITAGANHTCALVDNGTVYCWGSNTYGQLGDATNSTRKTPTQVVTALGGPALSNVTAITAGANHTCALVDNGTTSTVWCWGSNNSGQLGNGNTTDWNRPVNVGDLNNDGVTAITAGTNHTCARASLGDLSCWGGNNSGQLGDATTINKANPVSGVHPKATAVTAGGNHTCAIGGTGYDGVWCWGDNTSGQLGVGDLTNRTTRSAISSNVLMTITYNINYVGGTNPTPGTTTTGGTYPNPLPTPTRTGYTFNGWTRSGSPVTAGTAHGETNNFTLDAQWTADTLTITYDINYVGGTNPTSGTTTTGGNYPSLPTTTRTGYEFTGWYVAASGGTPVTAGTAHGKTSSFTLYAQWVEQLGINYVNQGGIQSGPSGSFTTTVGGTVSYLPTIARTGYAFNGWYTASSGGTQITTNNPHGQTSSFTLYAQWTANTLTITYDSQNGTTPTGGSNTTTTGGNYPSLPTTTRSGYTFAGWNTQADGSGTTVATNNPHSQTSDFTLYAQWTANTLTITYDINYVGGTSPSSGTTTTGGTITSLPTPPTRNGYVFAGWNTAPDGNGLDVGAIVTPNSDGPSHGQTSDFTLFAQWTADTLTITYDANGGTITATGSATTTVGGTITSLPTTTLAGFTFVGWFTASSGGTQVTANTAHGQTSDFTLFAQWSLVPVYALTYDANNGNGNPPSGATAATGATLIVASGGTLSRAGYTFAGWNTQADGTGSPYSVADIFTMGASHVTLFAQWTADTLTITYDANGGTITVTGSATTITGGTITSLPTTTRTGYTFAGWFTASSGGTQVSTSAAHGQTSNFTLHAQWNLAPVVQPVPPTLAPPVIAPAPPAALPSTITITMSDQSGVTFQHQQERIATGLSMSPGGRMSVVGAHYQSGSTVEIWINSTRVHLGTANVGRDNTFDLTTTLPIDIEPGVHTLEIIGIDIAGNSQTTFIAVTILEPGNIDEPIFELPVTGHDSDLLTNWSLALLVAGILVGVLSRRRGLLR